MVCGLLAFDDFEVLFRQIGHEPPLLVGYREQHVHARDVHRNARRLIGLLDGRRSRLLLAGRKRGAERAQSR